MQVRFRGREAGTGGLYRDWALLAWARLHWFGALGLGALGGALGTSVCRSVFWAGKPELAGFIVNGLGWAGLGCAGLAVVGSIAFVSICCYMVLARSG